VDGAGGGIASGHAGMSSSLSSERPTALSAFDKGRARSPARDARSTLAHRFAAATPAR
jgi:hypothetical protein